MSFSSGLAGLFDPGFRPSYVIPGQEFYGQVASLNLDGNLYTGLRVAFKVEKSLKPHPNQAEIRIWNLNEESRKKYTKDLLVSLQAGYKDNVSAIFLGNLKKVDHVRDEADWVTSARIGDGEKEIKKQRINTNFKPGSSIRDVVNALLKNLSESTGSAAFDVRLSIGQATDKFKRGDTQGALKILTRGYMAVGSTWDNLSQICNNLGYDVSIQDKEVVVLDPDETYGGTDVLLSQESGLVGSPEQAQDDYLKAKSLLNSQLVPGRGVNLQSAEFNGRYRIEKLVQIGDTHGRDWFSELWMKRL